MGLIVKKFGGTSVGTLSRIVHVAKLIIEAKAQGHDILVVVSAMAGMTNQLTALAHTIASTPNLREHDALLATGEMQSAALLAIELNAKGCPAQSLTAAQVRILGSNEHKYAQIKAIETNAIKRLLAAGKVPVVTGFQAINEFNDIVTLDRGGSDATAVALAYALKADECQIYTDVEGVYTADPRVCESAKQLERLDFDTMLQMADSGAKVLQHYSVKIAKTLNVPLRVRSSFHRSEGTLVDAPVRCQLQTSQVSAVSQQRGLVLLSFSAQSPARELPEIISIISRENIKIQHISQQFFSHGLTLNLVIKADDFARVTPLMNDFLHRWPQMKCAQEQHRAEVAIIGDALDHGHFLALQGVMRKALVVPDLIMSSPQKIALLFNEKALESVVALLHQHFIESP
ncbi:MAG: aspartate kinase [Gammaproteobacteria bacterium CG11_big_fil_rev_8_21_14_0_20_46_22]|nr:MAG: aspartate kinase [Gammaproteobacteria bacterium CG12_big_fil_rev_8_21_14_0_65_46_12]PIR10895.1 MAG: aspartate kinase [Gammaproteobacteria bacterium CG11_big_fil_rev_8_21_14_0_20_46_22]